MVPTYDLYEKTKIFLSPERKRWAPGATKALQEHIPATLDRGNLMWKIKTLQAAITIIYIWVVKLGVSKHIKNKFWGGGGVGRVTEGKIYYFFIIHKYTGLCSVAPGA